MDMLKTNSLSEYFSRTYLNIEVEVFCVVMLCSVAVECQCFRGPYCLHVKGEVTDDGKKRAHI